MIGSRLLFGGYRIGFKTNPLHAGFLGQDVLLVHDEAHLEPAFQVLIESIELEQAQHKVVRWQRTPGNKGQKMPWPKFRAMSLSATRRRGEESQTEDNAKTVTRNDNCKTIGLEPAVCKHNVLPSIQRQEVDGQMVR